MYPNLELAMFKRKITGREMARKLGIGESTMYKKLRGEYDLYFAFDKPAFCDCKHYCHLHHQRMTTTP